MAAALPRAPTADVLALMGRTASARHGPGTYTEFRAYELAREKWKTLREERAGRPNSRPSAEETMQYTRWLTAETTLQHVTGKTMDQLIEEFENWRTEAFLQTLHHHRGHQDSSGLSEHERGISCNPNSLSKVAQRHFRLSPTLTLRQQRLAKAGLLRLGPHWIV
ncbi:hypothetical protein JCM6882_002937 [Rhodosporidiobolus microsporus]